MKNFSGEWTDLQNQWPSAQQEHTWKSSIHTILLEQSLSCKTTPSYISRYPLMVFLSEPYFPFWPCWWRLAPWLMLWSSWCLTMTKPMLPNQPSSLLWNAFQSTLTEEKFSTLLLARLHTSDVWMESGAKHQTYIFDDTLNYAYDFQGIFNFMDRLGPSLPNFGNGSTQESKENGTCNVHDILWIDHCWLGRYFSWHLAQARTIMNLSWMLFQQSIPSS